MLKTFKRLSKFLMIGALIFIASYYAMGKGEAILINAGLILLAGSFFSKIIEINLYKKKYK